MCEWGVVLAGPRPGSWSGKDYLNEQLPAGVIVGGAGPSAKELRQRTVLQEDTMTSPVGGIDPHQDSFTVGIVDHHGIEISHQSFDNTGVGYAKAIDMLTTHGVHSVGV